MDERNRKITPEMQKTGPPERHSAKHADIDTDEKKPNRALERVKTAALVLLTFAMIALSVMYMVMSQRSFFREGSALSDGELSALLSADWESASAVLDPALIVPTTAVCRRNGGEMRGTIGDSSLMLASFADTVTAVLGSGYAGTKLDAESGNAAVKAAISAPDMLMFGFYGELPASVICAYLLGDTGQESAVLPTQVNYESLIASGDIALVRELYIYRGTENGAVHAAAVSDSGSVTLYTPTKPDNTAAIDTELMAAYEADPSLVTFAEMSGDFLAPSLPMPEDDFSLPQISLSAHLQSAWSSESSSYDLDDSVLRFFGYNPDRSSYYRDGGDLVYIEDHGTLRIGSEVIEFTASSENSGIELDSLLAYDTDKNSALQGGYSLFDLLKAAGVCISRMKEGGVQLCGGEASISLSSIRRASYDSVVGAAEASALSDGESVTDAKTDETDGIIALRFDYTVSGALLRGEDGRPLPALSFFFSGGRLLGFYFRSLSVTVSEQSMRMYPVTWTAERLADSGAAEGGRLIAVYELGDYAADAEKPVSEETVSEGTSAQTAESSAVLSAQWYYDISVQGGAS